MPNYYKIHSDGCTVELEPVYTELVPVVHGEWRWAEDGHCKCTVCGQYATVKRVVIKTNYCPNCGADMRERKGDDGEPL